MVAQSWWPVGSGAKRAGDEASGPREKYHADDSAQCVRREVKEIRGGKGAKDSERGDGRRTGSEGTVFEGCCLI